MVTRNNITSRVTKKADLSALPELKPYDAGGGDGFRFNANKVFLTYTNLPKKFKLKSFLRMWKAKADLKYWCIGKEKHKSGRIHFHAYFEFVLKLDKRGSKFFDLDHYGVRHPNVQRPRSFFKVIRYIQKEGLFITNLPNAGLPRWALLLDIEDKVEFYREILWETDGKLTSYTTIRLMEKIHDIENDPTLFNRVADVMKRVSRNNADGGLSQT